jgi:hypothetical protein
MKDKDFALRFAGIIFGIVAVFHLLRIIFEPSVDIAGWSLPIWVNWLGFFATAFLCGWLWSMSGSKNE